MSRPPLCRDHFEHARPRARPGRRVHRSHRRRHACVRQPRPPRRCRRPGARAQGLRTDQRQHAPTPPLLPPPDAGLLHVRPGRVAARCCPTSKAFFGRKRAVKKAHKQAVIALARRRLNVLWALLRDGRFFERSPPLLVAALG
ncbi:hypothetical protein OIF68_00885 [Actinacidiphila glaucinigra]